MDQNCQEIIKFPKDNPGAILSASSGVLIRPDLNWSFYVKSNTNLLNLDETIEVINETFKEVLNEFEGKSNLYNYKNDLENKSIFSNDNSDKELKECLIKELAMLSGLNNLVKCYNVRYDQNNALQQDLSKLHQIQDIYEKSILAHTQLIKKFEFISENEILECMPNNISLTKGINLGKEILQKPDNAINKYLEIKNGQVHFILAPPADSHQIIDFLNEIKYSLDDNDCKLNEYELLALEALASTLLYSYVINTFPDFDIILEILKAIKSETFRQLSKANQDIVIDLRGSDENQAFYQLIKEKLELTPNYPRNFWLDPRSLEKMQFSIPILNEIRKKIENPLSELDDSFQCIYDNYGLGFQIYFHSSQIDSENSQLLIFLNENCSFARTASINHQLGLLGDPIILSYAEQVLSNIITLDVLRNYHSELSQGKVDLIASGYDNSGCAATIIANKIAFIYPKIQVRSIAVGSTSFVSTEDAYNMNKAKNFFPIRLKYVGDKNIDRKIGAAYSDDTYYTFPLFVEYKQHVFDIKNHNKEEYGNVINFIPAMTKPLLLLNIYNEFNNYINYGKLDTSFISKIKFTEKQLVGFDKLVKFGQDQNLINSPNVFINVDNNQNFILKKLPPNLSEEEKTISALKEIVKFLKNIEIMSSVTANKSINLILIVDRLLINYIGSNLNLCRGKTPEIIDLFIELRELAISRLKYLNLEHPTQITESLKKNELLLKAIDRIAKNMPYNKDNKNFEKNKILERIDLNNDKFLEFLGFKIAFKDNEKFDDENYSSILHKDLKNKYEILLYTPEEIDKKQKIVICLNGDDVLGVQDNTNSIFGAGDNVILSRATILTKEIIKNLNLEFKKYSFNPDDVEIFLTGFGAEGAVAAAVGYELAFKYQHYLKSIICSIGFGAPRFTEKHGVRLIKNQNNFLPIRLLSDTDSTFDNRPLSDLIKTNVQLSPESYYRIPCHLRTGVFDTLKTHHKPDLYGDAHSIKRAIKNAYQMIKIGENTKNEIFATIQLKDDIKNNRIINNTKHKSLFHYSDLPIEAFQKILPTKLIKIFNYCVDLSENQNITQIEKDEVKKFFKKFISAIKNSDFNEKNQIQNSFLISMFKQGYRPDLLFGGKWKLQKLISEDLKNAMDAVDNAFQLNDKSGKELILKRNFYRGILAGDLYGNRYKPAGCGVNGALFFKHLESGIQDERALLSDEKEYRSFIGVFKPHPETVMKFCSMFNTQKFGERAKEYIGMAAYLNKTDSDCRVNNEIFAYELFHLFGFDHYISFPTTLKVKNHNHSKRPASFCDFLPNYDPVTFHVKKAAYKTIEEDKTNFLDDSSQQYSQKELTIWQISKLFDFLTGNLDGHEGNAFVRIEDLTLTAAANFDYDKAFPTTKNLNFKNQYKWADLKISKKSFTLDTIHALSGMLNGVEGKALEFLKKARKENMNNFSVEQSKCMIERIQILQRIISGEVITLSELVKYQLKIG
ncbi:MAG: hypothetical protein H0V82_09625 [Candidatus Protochlamydia sp.]|nr:hypothetical protein [Candidatus Protochlamydia sp.]